jgi:hypothetical protein
LIIETFIWKLSEVSSRNPEITLRLSFVTRLTFPVPSRLRVVNKKINIIAQIGDVLI